MVEENHSPGGGGGGGESSLSWVMRAVFGAGLGAAWAWCWEILAASCW